MLAERQASGAFYGRRKGKRLRQGQSERMGGLLPALRIDMDALGEPAKLFPRPVDEVWLEIGFGGGEHLLARARAHQNAGFIGCEPFVNGMAKLLAAIAGERLANIRLWPEDVTKLLPTLPDALFARVVILYPDPWPKRRQRKRRLVSETLLADLARVLRPGGDLLFATDIDDYAGWVLARVLRSPDFRWNAASAEDWRRPFPGWPGTRYEAKALSEGRVPTYLTFERL